ncbi:MAG: hypothetical protein ACJAWW_001894 [Sulfurimonas sp.]|jgi:hypothetical protein
MNKKLLKQALLFETKNPVYSDVKELCVLVVEYQDENNIVEQEIVYETY